MKGRSGPQGENTGEGNFQSLSTDELNGADLAGAAADTVPTAQGDGTLAMQAGGGGGVSLVDSRIDSVEDTDDTGAFNWNPSGFTSHDILILRATLVDEASSNHDVSITVEGDTTANYEWRKIADNSTVNGQSSWGLGTVLRTDRLLLVFAEIIPGGESSNQFPAIRTRIAGNGGGNPSGEIRGELTQAHSTITQLTLSSGANATGHAELYGYDY